jgi:8-oxo-dGTP pyrophosphatase MutT (NUDIX family)
MRASHTHLTIDQSGVIPCRIRRRRVEIALVTTRDGRRWTIPKGHIEEGMSPKDSAAKECIEEAGLVGSMLPEQICVYSYEKRAATRHVRVFLLLVKREMNEWPEKHFRRRKWMPVHRAIVCVTNRRLQGGFRRVEQMLNGHAAA